MMKTWVIIGTFSSPMPTPHKIQSTAAQGVIAVGVNFLFGAFSVSRAWLVIEFFAAGILVGWLTHPLIVHLN